MRRALVLSFFAAMLGGAIASAPACGSGGTTASSSSSSGAGGHAGGGGAGGGCSTSPEPSFKLAVRASKGYVPSDTTILVKWSAGTEPELRLDDPSTWKTLAEANLACSLDPKNPPKELDELDCEIWTSGATEIAISAKAYVGYDMTLTPTPATDQCMHPGPVPVKVVLVHEGDGG